MEKVRRLGAWARGPDSALRAGGSARSGMSAEVIVTSQDPHLALRDLKAFFLIILSHSSLTRRGALVANCVGVTSPRRQQFKGCR